MLADSTLALHRLRELYCAFYLPDSFQVCSSPCTTVDVAAYVLTKPACSEVWLVSPAAFHRREGGHLSAHPFTNALLLRVLQAS